MYKVSEVKKLASIRSFWFFMYSQMCHIKSFL